MKEGTSSKRPRGAEKKAETIRKRQERDKEHLLGILRESPNLGVALSRVGINRSTFNRWRDADPNFSLDARCALEEGIDKTVDVVETSLISKARDGSFPAQKFYLQNNHERYMPPHKAEPIENPLTEERKKEIADAMRAWSVPETGDERLEDYLG